MKASRLRIASVVADKALKDGAEPVAKQLAAYLLDTRRVNELYSVLRDIQSKWAEAGYVEVVATSAHPLNDEIKKRIELEVRKAFPDAKRINVNEVLDESVLEGVRLNFANHQLDLSAEAKINKFRQLTMAGKD